MHVRSRGKAGTNGLERLDFAARIYVAAALGIPPAASPGSVPLTIRENREGDGFLLFSHVERKVRLHSTWMRVPKGERRKLSGGSRVERAESSVGPAKPSSRLTCAKNPPS